MQEQRKDMQQYGKGSPHKRDKKIINIYGNKYSKGQQNSVIV